MGMGCKMRVGTQADRGWKGISGEQLSSANVSTLRDINLVLYHQCKSDFWMDNILGNHKLVVMSNTMKIKYVTSSA
jgi:hypothetical protein